MTNTQIMLLLLVGAGWDKKKAELIGTLEEKTDVNADLLELAERGLILNSMEDENRQDAVLMNRRWILSQQGLETIKATRAVTGLAKYYYRVATN